MGTRNLTLVQLDGKYRISKYGQWDGYPSSRGLGILKFLRTYDPDSIAEKTIALKEMSKEEFQAMGDDYSDFIDAHPELSRDNGGEKFLQMMMDDQAKLIYCDTDFIADSLFCEWAYVIDLDQKKFEVFQGFNKEPLQEGERFFDWTGKREQKEYKNEDGSTYRYYPCKLKACWLLSELPSDDAFLATCEPESEEDE